MVRIDQLVGRWRRLHQDAEPAEWVAARELVTMARGDGGAGNAVKAVATGNKVGMDFFDFAVVVEARLGRRRIEVVKRRVLHAEQDLSAGGEARGDQVL